MIMHNRLARLVLALGLLIMIAPRVAMTQTGRTTGLPLPRFVSLDSDKVNVRFGPGTQYPINWVYTQRGIPLEITAEFDTWRKIRDYEGAEGWVLSSLLSSRRTILIQDLTRDLKRTPDEGARVVLRAEPGVVGRLFECADVWCRVEIEGRRGWLRRGEFWGLSEGETVH
jgi:SH3-like domain-containing protein